MKGILIIPSERVILSIIPLDNGDKIITVDKSINSLLHRATQQTTKRL